MKKLVIMRGCPGSGKSYLAKQIVAQHGQEESCIASADNYFMVNGVYRWDGNKLRDAHHSCKVKVEKLMQEEAPLVVVDNTNTKRKEMQPYFELAVGYGYEVEFATPTTSWAWDAAECFKRNSHNVPLDAIKAMIGRFEKNVTVDEMVQDAKSSFR